MPAPRRALGQKGNSAMADIGCIAAGIVFFLIAIAYTTACDRLGTPLKESK